MVNTNVIGIDLGASNIRGAVVDNDAVMNILSQRINNQGSVDEVLNEIIKLINNLTNSHTVKAIGIGVPGVVDVIQGIVYDVVNIPLWKEVPLKNILESHFNIPVFINNDANCFAVGEHYFGKGKETSSMVGLTIGTGMGAGLIINNKLFTGQNCGAGEVGMLPYLDNILEYYASGSFFFNVYGNDGIKVFEEAKNGDSSALKLYDELGIHIGNAIKMVMYAYDPELIILGGSVRNSYVYFQKEMWNQISTFAFSKSAQRIKIEISELPNSGILGAAALYYDSIK